MLSCERKDGSYDCELFRVRNEVLITEMLQYCQEQAFRPVPQENSLFVEQAGKPVPKQVIENGAKCEEYERNYQVTRSRHLSKILSPMP